MFLRLLAAVGLSFGGGGLLLIALQHSSPLDVFRRGGESQRTGLMVAALNSDAPSPQAANDFVIAADDSPARHATGHRSLTPTKSAVSVTPATWESNGKPCGTPADDSQAPTDESPKQDSAGTPPATNPATKGAGPIKPTLPDFDALLAERKQQVERSARPHCAVNESTARPQREEAPRTGQHVEFPEFAHRPPRDPDTDFNPGDKVEARVARLYYFRDAQRVAQIINRNVQSYNRAAVAMKERLAESARNTADEKTTARREKERAAVRAAEATRETEADLAQLREELEQARARLALIVQQQAQPATEKQAADLNRQHELAQQVVRDTAKRVAQQEPAVAAKRNHERDAQAAATQAQEVEDRAREHQFRAELAAANEDPDTYVAGRVCSIDPVTQVSVSVIGEGLIQMRGPIRGINKIRTMINQIDSPVGQVKIGIFTVQVNGEHGDRMEKVAGRVEGHLDLSRFLTNQSLAMLRRAIQEIAGVVVASVEAECPGHRQLDRDRKYLYAFFGRDFIDELYEMDSEFLRTENKLLSLHAMDTISLSQACFIMALAKNDIREQILARFRSLIECELPLAEFDFRKTSGLLPCKLNSVQEVCKNACLKYKFRNLHGFFAAWVAAPDAMTPMQREFIRMAQMFKSQMIAEMEFKQRVTERGLIEEESNDEHVKAKLLQGVRSQAMGQVRDAYQSYVASTDRVLKIGHALAALQFEIQAHETLALQALDDIKLVAPESEAAKPRAPGAGNGLASAAAAESPAAKMFRTLSLDEQLTPHAGYGNGVNAMIRLNVLVSKNVPHSKLLRPLTKSRIATAWERAKAGDLSQAQIVAQEIQKDVRFAAEMRNAIEQFSSALDNPRTPYKKVEEAWRNLVGEIQDYQTGVPTYLDDIKQVSQEAFQVIRERELTIRHAEYVSNRVKQELDHRKLLEHLIDEQEEKHIELVEGSRSHIAQIDNYLKRLAIALEDDFKVQFYDPGFAGVREASREWDVNLGQVERTTILTNNRQFAKVSPQATMEFDLPKRAPMIVEGMQGARALVQDYGTLLQDPTFLSLAGMLSGSPATSGTAAGNPVPGLRNQGLRSAGVRNVLPGQSTDSSEQLMAQTGGPDRQLGAALEALIPDPAVYKFETGTGFEIRPVIQPDGHSVIYDFDYMYTTNVREPVRPDEKHLGRVKRHFIHTQVQTSSFELREVSRYQVALKASRTSRGVPLLEDLPGAGVLFRPLPSAESALQQNIILAQCTVYPTLFDLMGLRWSKYVADLDHVGLRDLEHVIRGREQAIHDFTFDEAARRVDEFLNIQSKHDDHLRPDLYHPQRATSPYHPGGYEYEPTPRMADPQKRHFLIPDRRPEEYRTPPYDPWRRNPMNEWEAPANCPAPAHNFNPKLHPPEDSPTSAEPNSPPQLIPPAPMNPGARRTTAPATDVIQPATYEQSTVRSAPRPESRGASRSAPAPSNPQPPISIRKKTWFSKLK